MNSPSPRNVLTPVKRLGLSRKKSTSGSPLAKGPLHKINTTGLSTSEALIFTPNKLRASLPEVTANTDEERVQELNMKLLALNDTSELEEAVTVWKAGCKDALIDLKEWLAAEEGVTITCESLVEKLGIRSVLMEHFENDCDIFDE